MPIRRISTILLLKDKASQIVHMYKVTPHPEQKNRTYIFLTEIHKFNSSLFFFSGYEVDSVHEKLRP